MLVWMIPTCRFQIQVKLRHVVPLLNLDILIVVRYTSYSEPLCIQSRKPFPGTFCPKTWKIFRKKFFFFFF